MKWKKVIKDASKQPKKGKYSDWKEQIASECYNQCVYCSIHEQQFGGIDNYHVEHFRPKSLKQFKHLENDILNLFYSCPICNRFKGNDWPDEPDDLNKICYPDPSKVDYSELFKLEDGSYLLIGNFASGTYLVERLFLNRAQLIYERREHILNQKERGLNEELKKLEDELINSEPKNALEFIKVGLRLRDQNLDILHKRKSIRPYRQIEVRRN